MVRDRVFVPAIVGVVRRGRNPYVRRAETRTGMTFVAHGRAVSELVGIGTWKAAAVAVVAAVCGSAALGEGALLVLLVMVLARALAEVRPPLSTYRSCTNCATRCVERGAPADATPRRGRARWRRT